jgi:hypothetical protein
MRINYRKILKNSPGFVNPNKKREGEGSHGVVAQVSGLSGPESIALENLHRL